MRGVQFSTKEVGVFGLLLMLTLIVRLPFVFPAVLNWDESTFVLMGQSIVDGYLPYVKLWDNKPPLAFAFYALVIALFGKDMLYIRLAGTLCVVVAAFFVYLLAYRLWDRRTGLIAAILCIVAISLLQTGQATMTEHVVLLPLLGAVYLLIRRNESVSAFFLIGMLMATATLVRLNMGFVAIMVGAYILATSVHARRSALPRIAAYCFGGILIVAITVVPYWLTGQQEIWWTSVIAAPLRYSDSQSTIFRLLVSQVRNALGFYWDGAGYKFGGLNFNIFIWSGAVAGLTMLLWRWRSLGQVKRRGITVLILMTVGTSFGILKSGAGYEHYMIQLVPFAALFAVAFIEQLPIYVRGCSWLGTGVLIIVSTGPIFAEYGTMFSRLRGHENLRYGAQYEIAAYLSRENSSGGPMYLLTDHIVYWFTNSYPLTRLTTHPSNIAKPSLREALFGKGDSTEDELRKVFRKAPEFVVMSDDVFYLSGGPKTLLERILVDDYFLATEIQGRKIYRAKPKRALQVQHQAGGVQTINGAVQLGSRPSDPDGYFRSLGTGRPLLSREINVGSVLTDG